MEQITNTSYIFTKEPVNFQFRHLEDAVLSVATHYRFINMQPHGDGIDLEFDGGSLSLTQKVRKFCFRWQGGGSRSEFPSKVAGSGWESWSTNPGTWARSCSSSAKC